jgi:hypothetical protein
MFTSFFETIIVVVTLEKQIRGKGLVVLAYLKETQKGANIGRRKGA